MNAHYRTFGWRLSNIWSTILPKEIYDRIFLQFLTKMYAITSFRLNISDAGIASTSFFYPFFVAQIYDKAECMNKILYNLLEKLW